MNRDLNVVANEICRHIGPDVQKYPHAWPYAVALSQLHDLKDEYGYDDGVGIALRLLFNLSSWRGDDARRLKAELNKMIKEVKDV